jgi:erythromycin esterase-like protein
MLRFPQRLIISIAFLCFTEPAFAQPPLNNVRSLLSGDLSGDYTKEHFIEIFNHRIPDNLTVLGLGEVSHGSYEPIAFKANIAKYLIEERGYRKILFEHSDIDLIRGIRAYLAETNLADSNFVKTWIANGNFPHAISAVYLNLFEWIKAYNMENPTDQVQVMGFDCATEQNNVEFILNTFMIPFDPVQAQEYVYKLHTDGEDADKVRILQQWFQDNESSLKKKFNPADLGWLKFYIRNTINGLTYQSLKSGSVVNDISLFRDSILAENVEYLSSGSRSIVWAHNGHILRTHTNHMGRLLHQKFETGYFVIATDFSGHAAVEFLDAASQSPERAEYKTAVFRSAPTSAAYKLSEQQQPEERIVFLNEIKAMKIGTNSNAIDTKGQHVLIPGTANSFDVLAVFKNISYKKEND